MRITQPRQRLMTVPRPAPAPDPEPPDFTSCLTGPQGLELVVEMAHDLRSPLAAILMLAESLQSGQGGPVSARQRRQLGLIYSAALRLCALSSDAVELARGGNRLVDETPAPLSLGEILGSVRDTVQPVAEEKGLVLRIESVAQDRRLGYARALSRVLLNLTTNALKFTDAGSVVVSARVTGSSRMEFAVRDTGPGIDEESMQHLYQPFVTGTASRRAKFSGSGLGLAICRKLVAAMGGELQVESTPGCGTRFWFELELPPVR
jgi:signal transduction histidine kinase